MSDALTTFLSEFERIKAGAGGPVWLPAYREAAVRRFESLGFPTTKNEEWKYTNVAPIAQTPFRVATGNSFAFPASTDIVDCAFGEWDAFLVVLVNGAFSAALSRLTGLPVGVRIGGLSESLTGNTGFGQAFFDAAPSRESAFTALNAAFLSDGAYIRIPKGISLIKPIQILSLASVNGTALAFHPRNVIVLEENARAEIVENFCGPDQKIYFTNAVTDVRLGPNAVLEHYKVQNEGDGAFHIGTMRVTQDRDSRLRTHSVSFGGRLVRSDVEVDLAAEGVEAELNGLYLTDEGQHVDHHTRIDHLKPNGKSHEDYRGILNGKSRAVFNGKIYVEKDAQKTDAVQNNKNLLLSRDALVNTKPQLEIYADDVKCTHGATVGQLDTNALFYLRSRGLDEAEARRTLIYGFAGDVVGRIKPEPIRRRIDEILLHRLNISGEGRAD